MRPVLFCWRNVTVRSYPAMLYLGLVFGVVAGNIAAHVAGIHPLRAYIATLLLIVPALAGARLLFVATHWDVYRHNLRRIRNRREGGLSMYGGLLLALLVSVPLLRIAKLNFGAFWDVASFTILVGMIFARVGCLLNGCCSGRRVRGRFGVLLPDASGVWERRLPSQMLEALVAGLLLAGASVVWRLLPFPGALFLLMTLAYSGARFAMEFARERPAGSSRLRESHAISAVSFISCVCLLMRYWRQ